MDPVVFFDPASPAPYSARSLEEGGQGGTEATVVRVAEGLDALVVQPGRVEAEGRYLPADRPIDPANLVVVRDPRSIEPLHRRHPAARFHLWLHDRMRPGSRRARRLRALAPGLADIGITIVCVSDYLRRDVEATLAPVPGAGRIPVRTIYNPIADDLLPDGSPVDRSRLVFFSAPAKGLRYTLDAFAAARRALPDLTLEVANPGYHPTRPRPIDGVQWLGPLPHAAIIRRVRTALCVFYPNFVVAETFGLVLAEANAVGTPVLTHAAGAAPEVLHDPRQTLPVEIGQRIYEQLTRVSPDRWRGARSRVGERLGIFEPYLDRLMSWRQGGRPSPAGDDRFRARTVVVRWRDHLGLG